MKESDSVFGVELDRLKQLLTVGKEESLEDSSEHTSRTTSFYNLLERPGMQIGRYKLLRVLGEGGMGVVYLAQDTRLDRSVAIKSIPAELQAIANAQARFKREAKLLASLNHPNIAVIHDIIEENKSGYLILEYVPGETLAERIARKPLTFEETFSIGQQIARAVSAAHKKGIVHRDLKPSNIKITPEGQIKVLDFGIAKPSSSENLNIDVTATEPNRVIGTPAYMSPEQARGKSIDHRTDVWSFGCILFQMLTGQLPFEGETVTDILARIIEGQPNWELLPQNTPANVRSLVHSCLEKDPDRRLGDIAGDVFETSKTLSRPQTVPPVKLRRIVIIGVVVIGIILSVIALKFLPNKNVLPSSPVIKLVILPFENLGSSNDEVYSSAITAEIIGRLVGLNGLAVSSEEIAENRAMLLGKDSGVDYVLKGTIQCVELSEPNTQVIRIRPQLIRISDSQYVWAEPYDKEISQTYQIPSELAEKVAYAMNIALLDSERQEIGSLPTENEEAYMYYLRGNHYLNRSYLEKDFRIAIRMYETSVELDPTFALAYSQLSRSHLQMIWWYFDRSEGRYMMAKQAVDKALQLNPELPEAHLALGHYYYHARLDYDRALEQFVIARKRQPNNGDPLRYIGYVQRRQGKFEQGLANIKRAYELNPLSGLRAREVGETYLLLHEYQQTERYLERAISLAPELPVTYVLQARLYLSWEGNTERARSVLQEGLEYTKQTKKIHDLGWLVTLDLYDRNYKEALDRVSLRSVGIDFMFYFIPNALLRARIYRYMNQADLAKKYYDEARNILESKIEEQSGDARFHSSLGIAYAGLGRKADAILEGKLAVELLPVSKEAIRGVFRVEDLARIYVMVGELDAAIDQLEFLLSIPCDMSIPILQLDPAWDPLRNLPRFKKLMETYK